MKALFLALVLALTSFAAEAAPSIFGTWVYRQGSWPDTVEIRMTVGQNKTRFLTSFLMGGAGCSVDITVPTVVRGQYFQVLRSVRRRGSGFANCEATVSAQRATYVIRGNKLILNDGRRTTTYTRSR